MSRSRPRISILIPTIGKGSLARCLDSIVPQVREGDEIIVLGDEREGKLPDVESVTVSRRLCTYLPLAESKVCDWGHANLNRAMRCAKGEWITWTDDDDVYTPGAIEAIRKAAARLTRPGPLIFRYRTPYGYVVPPYAGKPAEGHMSGQCLVIPNIPEYFGTWSVRYEGDYDMIQSTLAAWGAAGIRAVWRPEIIGAGRPQEIKNGSIPKAVYPPSLECSPAYQWITGMSPSLIPKPKAFKHYAAYGMLTILSKINRLWWSRLPRRLDAFFVETLDLARQMLRINELCRHRITYNDIVINEEGQRIWWETNKDRIKAWLYRNAEGVMVGFGLLQRGSDRLLRLRLGVLPYYIGNGYSRWIAARVIRKTDEPVVAAVPVGLPSAHWPYQKCDWAEIERNKFFVLYRTRGKLT